MRHRFIIIALLSLFGSMLTSPAAMACSCRTSPFSFPIPKTEAEAWRQGEMQRSWLVGEGRRNLKDFDLTILVGTIYRMELIEERNQKHAAVRFFVRAQEIWAGTVQRELIVIDDGPVPSCSWQPNLGRQEPLVIRRVANGTFRLAELCMHALFTEIYLQGLIATVTETTQPIARFAD